MIDDGQLEECSLQRRGTRVSHDLKHVQLNRVCVTQIAEATLLSVRGNRGVTNENEFVIDVLYIVHKSMKVT